MARVTLHDVAREAGVSDSTVSRSLRGLDKVDERTRRTVKEAAQRLHFSFARNASSLASGKTMRVSLLFSDALNTWFDAGVMQGAYEVLVPSHYDIIPNMVRDHSQLDEFFDRLPAGGNVDAVVVASINLSKRHIGVLKHLTIPTVGLDSRTITGFDASVLMDDKRAMDDAVRLLRALGHRNIGFVGWPEPGDLEFSTQLRVRDFVEAAQAQGYSRRQVQHFDLGKVRDYRSRDEALDAAASRILQAPVRPTAICVETDDFAVPLVARLRSKGMRVPEDMSVIGFDDNDVAGAVGLTTIHQDPVDMSRNASLKALSLMRSEPLAQPHDVVRSVLMVRDTTTFAPEQ